MKFHKPDLCTECGEPLWKGHEEGCSWLEWDGVQK